MLQNLSYRTEIDGMRTIAVAGVVRFHLGMPFAGAGFGGVDVFFVISGWLITSLIKRRKKVASALRHSTNAASAVCYPPVVPVLFVTSLGFYLLLSSGALVEFTTFINVLEHFCLGTSCPRRHRGLRSILELTQRPDTTTSQRQGSLMIVSILAFE